MCASNSELRNRPASAQILGLKACTITKQQMQFLIIKNKLKPGTVTDTFNLSLEAEAEELDLCEIKITLVHRVSSRTAVAMCKQSLS